MTAGELNHIAARIRGKVIEMSHRAGTPHLGSSLSCVDILVAAYWGALRVDPQRPDAPERDRLILSKGHAATALYAALACRGYFCEERLAEYAVEGGAIQEHPGPGCLPGVEMATGSLGHGLPVANGMAIAARLQGMSFRIAVVMSDGECNEGAVWEAAMFAAANRLAGVLAVIDYNKWQATGRSDEIMALAPLRDKWAAFGWDAREVDGHDIETLMRVMALAPDRDGRPRAVVAHTVKGKGVSFMEDDNNWHYRVPTAEEVKTAFEELGLP